MNLKSFIPCIIVLTIFCFGIVINTTPHINSFKQLAQHHCRQFPIEILYRLSSGTLAQKYGSKYAQIDCYIRQFVNQDGQNKQLAQAQQQQQSQENQSQENQQQQEYKYPENDPIMALYAQGLTTCLPQNTDSLQATYKIWRFYRFLIQHDYAFQWMRAKIRSGLGYQAQKSNAWMDGQPNAQRLRLDKLFSNQFYDYIDKLMFKDFLFPLMTFLRKNVVVGLQGTVTRSGKPMVLQYIQSRNIIEQFFKPIVFVSKQTNNNKIFSYTLPGIPLFLAGSSNNLLWAFTGVLVDRSNVQQIQTVGNKFYHHGVQQWVKLNNVSIQISVKQSQPFICKFVHSSYGTLYQKHTGSGKISEYITRWHEDQVKVRNIFSELLNLINNQGNMERDMQFPFNSLVLANNTGVYNYLCQQYHPSYFIYPDLASQPDRLKQRWVSNPKKGILTIANSHLTTHKQEAYLKKELLNPMQQQLTIELRRLTRQKVSLDQLWTSVLSIFTDPLVKKRKDHLIFMYRKAKFVFFPQQQQRKQCDQLLSVVQKWDDNFNSQMYTPVFTLWDYFFREYTFNHVSSSKIGAHLAKHHALTDTYWTNQPELWKKTISYGQCDSNQWHDQKWNVRLNNTGLNCTCFFNIMRGLNRTRQILRNKDGSINQNIKLSTFRQKKLIDLTEKYVGDHIDEAFNNFYSKNLAFVAQVNNPSLKYLHTYKQIQETVNISQNNQQQENSQQEL